MHIEYVLNINTWKWIIPYDPCVVYSPTFGCFLWFSCRSNIPWMVWDKIFCQLSRFLISKWMNSPHHLCLDQCTQLSGLDRATSVWIKFQKPTSKKLHLISETKLTKTTKNMSLFFALASSIWIYYIFYLASIQVFWISSGTSWPFSQQFTSAASKPWWCWAMTSAVVFKGAFARKLEQMNVALYIRRQKVTVRALNVPKSCKNPVGNEHITSLSALLSRWFSLLPQVGCVCHGNVRYPPKATPPRNKALLRDY